LEGLFLNKGKKGKGKKEKYQYKLMEQCNTDACFGKENLPPIHSSFLFFR
jgi:hypothetical protein